MFLCFFFNIFFMVLCFLVSFFVIDDKNIDFRIKKHKKHVFVHFYKKTLKNMHKNIKTTGVIKWV